MKKNNKGFTFLELLMSIFIIALMSSIFWINLREDYKDIVEIETERAAADIKKARSMALSQIPDDATGEYPAGGYGVHFYNSPPRYVVFADHNELGGYSPSTDTIIKEVVMNEEIDSAVVLGDVATSFYFVFQAANEARTNMLTNVAEFYVMGIVSDDYRGNIRLGEETEDGFTWTNIGTSFDLIDPGNPTGGGRGGKIQMEDGGGGEP